MVKEPIILAPAHPDPKKNMTTLVKAFGECNKSRKVVNLMLIMGNRNDIDGMPATSANVITTILKLIDKYHLYGEVAYPYWALSSTFYLGKPLLVSWLVQLL